MALRFKIVRQVSVTVIKKSKNEMKCSFVAGVSWSDGQCTSCRAGQGAGAESERQSTEDCRRNLGQFCRGALYNDDVHLSLRRSHNSNKPKHGTSKWMHLLLVEKTEVTDKCW